MPKNKYYAVKCGRIPGIYRTWEGCQKQVEGFSRAVYRSFKTYEEAQNYLDSANQDTPEENVSPVTCPKGHLLAYVDGSYYDKAGRYSYGCVIITPSGEEIHLSGSDNNPEMNPLRNIAGEMLGAMTAVEWAAAHGYALLDLYYDYEGLGKWAAHEWKTKKEATKKYVEFMDDYSKKIQIVFHKVTAHSGVKYNDKADKLARNALLCHND